MAQSGHSDGTQYLGLMKTRGVLSVASIIAKFLPGSALANGLGRVGKYVGEDAGK
jgi:hypothetical protein